MTKFVPNIIMLLDRDNWEMFYCSVAEPVYFQQLINDLKAFTRWHNRKAQVFPSLCCLNWWRPWLLMNKALASAAKVYVIFGKHLMNQQIVSNIFVKNFYVTLLIIMSSFTRILVLYFAPQQSWKINNQNGLFCKILQNINVLHYLGFVCSMTFNFFLLFSG